MSDADRVRAFLEGWDAALRCNAETMSWVPPEHLEYARTNAVTAYPREHVVGRATLDRMPSDEHLERINSDKRRRVVNQLVQNTVDGIEEPS